MHSSNPRRRSSCHVLSSTPYLMPSHEVFPALHRCGGSNTTSRKLSSGNGISRKSAIRSGFTSNRRPSQRYWAKLRLSMNTVAGFSLSNQNIRDPQQASSICFIAHLHNPTYHIVRARLRHSVAECLVACRVAPALCVSVRESLQAFTLRRCKTTHDGIR